MNRPIAATSGANVALGAVVLPSHVGAAHGWAGDRWDEPQQDINYERGKIVWENTTDGTIGHARICVPSGPWNFLLFFQQEQFLRANQIQSRLFFKPGFMDIDIEAKDYIQQAGLIK